MSIKEDFEIFHHENPNVFELFKRYATIAKGKGFTRFSAKAVFERLRWHMNFETNGDTFKLNNNYTSLYARKLISEAPEFEDFFELRVRKSID